MPSPVIAYGAAWNPATNQGRFFVELGVNQPLTNVPITSPDEFIILLMMLSKPGVQFDPTTREIQIPTRPAGS